MINHFETFAVNKVKVFNLTPICSVFDILESRV